MNADLMMLLAEMQADFIGELPDRCTRLEERVMALKRGTSGAFDELYREVHSLKGSGGVFGVPVISTICRQFESFISEAHHCFDQTASGTSLAYVDLLRKAASPQGREPEGVAAIEQALAQLPDSRLDGPADAGYRG